MKRLSNHPAASDEIDKAYTWFALRSVQAADSFYEELFLTVKRLHRQPTLFQRYLRGTRRAVLDQNPYPVIFRELPRKIEIIAVAHAKRRPTY